MKTDLSIPEVVVVVVAEHEGRSMKRHLTHTAMRTGDGVQLHSLASLSLCVCRRRMDAHARPGHGVNDGLLLPGRHRYSRADRFAPTNFPLRTLVAISHIAGGGIVILVSFSGLGAKREGREYWYRTGQRSNYCGGGGLSKHNAFQLPSSAVHDVNE